MHFSIHLQFKSVSLYCEPTGCKVPWNSWGWRSTEFLMIFMVLTDSWGKRQANQTIAGHWGLGVLVWEQSVARVSLRTEPLYNGCVAIPEVGGSEQDFTNGKRGSSSTWAWTHAGNRNLCKNYKYFSRVGASRAIKMCKVGLRYGHKIILERTCAFCWKQWK